MKILRLRCFFMFFLCYFCRFHATGKPSPSLLPAGCMDFSFWPSYMNSTWRKIIICPLGRRKASRSNVFSIFSYSKQQYANMTERYVIEYVQKVFAYFRLPMLLRNALSRNSLPEIAWQLMTHWLFRWNSSSFQ